MNRAQPDRAMRPSARRNTFGVGPQNEERDPFEEKATTSVDTLRIVHPSMIATARVQPAEARSILVGKQETVKPVDGSASRLCNFSIWQ